MGTSQTKYEEFDREELKEMKRLIKEKGIVAAQELMREKGEQQRATDIKIGVAGNSGVGKSSFVNAIRGIDDEDEGAARTGVVETTLEPAYYDIPNKSNIEIVDLPAVGTPTYPNVDTFCKKVCFETYDIFLILTTVRLTMFDIELARKMKSMGKRFFLIRTKIDQDEMYEKRQKNCDIEAMLQKTRAHLYESVKDLEIREDEIFLISNHYTEKWDFKRLIEAITERLPASQKKLYLMILSEDIVRKKVQVLRGRVKYVALFRSIIVKLFTCICRSTTYSRQNDFKLIFKKVEFYRSELGFPAQDSENCKVLNQVLQNKVRKFYLTSEMNVDKCGEEDTASGDRGTSDCDVGDETLPWLDRNKAIEFPYTFVYRSLHHALDDMEETAMKILQFTAAKSVRDNDVAM